MLFSSSRCSILYWIFSNNNVVVQVNVTGMIIGEPINYFCSTKRQIDSKKSTRKAGYKNVFYSLCLTTK